MTPAPEPMPRASGMKSLLPAIYACRKQVEGLGDDAAWRGFLTQHAGKESLRFMTGGELGRVLDALHRAGAPKRPGRGAGGARLDDRPQARMARGLWIELAKAGAVRDGSEAALENFGKRITGKARLKFCTPANLNDLIEALKEWRNRHDAADPVVAVAEALEVPEGWTRDQALIPALWEALIQAGAMEHGIHARLDTWLRKNGGSLNPKAVDPARAEVCAMKLGAWLRKHVAAQAQAAWVTKQAERKDRRAKERADG
jgi:hypothetical protein